MVVSSEILSPHLNLARDILKAIDVPANNILSGNSWIAPTQRAYERGTALLIPYKGALGNITSDNAWIVHDFGRNGYASGQIDDGVARGNYHFAPFDSWKAPKPMSEYVSPIFKTPESYVAVEFEERPWQAPEGQSPLRKFVTDVDVVDYPNNALGPALSRAYTLKKDITNYIGTDEGKAAISHLLSIGGKPKIIDYVVVGGLPEGSIFGVGYLNGKVAVHVAKDAYDLIVGDAKHYGIKPNDRKNAGILEELTHIYLGHLNDARNPNDKEIEAKLVQADFHAEQEANAATGNPRDPRYVKLMEKHRGLKEFRIEDASTVPIRYKDLYSSDKASLRKKFAEEAKRKGLQKGAVDEYVDGRMAQLESEDRKSPSEFEALVDREARNVDREASQESRDSQGAEASAD